MIQFIINLKIIIELICSISLGIIAIGIYIGVIKNKI